MTLAVNVQAANQPSTVKAISHSPSSPLHADADGERPIDNPSEPMSLASDAPVPVDARSGRRISPERFAALRAEEPLYLPTDYGAGFFPGEPGMKLKRGHYQIILKLGWGRQSSTWLVLDTTTEPAKYYAAKIINASNTEVNKDGLALERECLQAIAEDAAKNPSLPHLIDQFELEGPHGSHICLVMNVLSTDIQSYKVQSPERRLALHSVRYIIESVLKALVILEKRNIIHTDLKPDNIMFVNDSDIAQFLEETVPTTVCSVLIHDDLYPLMRSQPIGSKFRWDDSKEVHAKYNICLADFGSAQRADRPPTTESLSAYALRAPEIILGGPITTKVDIWALGCITFELLVGRWMFPLAPCGEYSLESEHIARMAELTEQVFEEDFLKTCKYRDEFFDPDGRLYMTTSTNINVQRAISNYTLPDLSPNDVSEVSSFISTCLTLDPSKRPLASELVTHPWLKGASDLDDYRDPRNIIREQVRNLGSPLVE